MDSWPGTPVDIGWKVRFALAYDRLSSSLLAAAILKRPYRLLTGRRCYSKLSRTGAVLESPPP